MLVLNLKNISSFTASRCFITSFQLLHTPFAKTTTIAAQNRGGGLWNKIVSLADSECHLSAEMQKCSFNDVAGSTFSAIQHVDCPQSLKYTNKKETTTNEQTKGTSLVT